VMHSADIKDLNEQKLRKIYTKLKTFAYFVSEYLGYEKKRVIEPAPTSGREA
jgi:hypothetical protein